MWGWSTRWLSQSWSLPSARWFFAGGEGLSSGPRKGSSPRNLSLLPDAAHPGVCWHCHSTARQVPGDCQLVWIQARRKHLNQSNGPIRQMFFPFRESVYQHTLWLLLSWVTLSKEVMENHSEWVCLSIRMGIIIFLTSWGCGGNKWVHEKASSPGPGSITLQFILLLQKFPIMFSPWEHIVALQSLSRVQLFVIPWTAAYQASLVFCSLQVLMQYCSLLHQTFSPSDTSTTKHYFRFGFA